MRTRPLTCLFATFLVWSYASIVIAQEIWIAPTHQSDTEPPALVEAWPTTAFGLARFAFALPDGLQTVTSAKILVVRQASSAGVYSAYACSGQHGSPISGACNAALSIPFGGAPNLLMDLDVTELVSSLAATPAKYMSLLFWTSTAATDRVVGLRVSYEGLVHATSLNTRLGTGALTANSTGTGNTAIGANTLLVNETGSENTAIGHEVLRHNDVGVSNTGVGFGALRNNTDGGVNVAVGAGALAQNTNGSANTGLGFSALSGTQEGVANTGVGAFALRSLGIGEVNTAVGTLALASLTLGHNNIAVGNEAGIALTNGNSNVFIGSGGVDGDTSTIRIGPERLRAFIGGISGVPIVGSSSGVVVNADGQLGILPSSARFKADIETLADVSEALHRLRPVSFAYDAEPTDAPAERHFGLIAEEVAELLPEIVGRDRSGQPLTVDYVELIPLLIGEVQRLTRRVDALERSRVRERAR